jgi:hypothetical protein
MTITTTNEINRTQQRSYFLVFHPENNYYHGNDANEINTSVNKSVRLTDARTRHATLRDVVHVNLVSKLIEQ